MIKWGHDAKSTWYISWENNSITVLVCTTNGWITWWILIKIREMVERKKEVAKIGTTFQMNKGQDKHMGDNKTHI